jgi:hypothetical protein
VEERAASLQGRYRATLPMALRASLRGMPRMLGYMMILGVMLSTLPVILSGRLALEASWIDGVLAESRGMIETLILAIMIGLIAMPAFALLQHFLCRPAQRELEIEVGPQALVWTDAESNRLSLRWSTFRRVIETPSMLYFVLPFGGLRWVPISAFAVDHLPRLRALVAASGVKAILRG